MSHRPLRRKGMGGDDWQAWVAGAIPSPQLLQREAVRFRRMTVITLRMHASLYPLRPFGMETP